MDSSSIRAWPGSEDEYGFGGGEEAAELETSHFSEWTVTLDVKWAITGKGGGFALGPVDPAGNVPVFVKHADGGLASAAPPSTPGEDSHEHMLIKSLCA